MIRRLAAEILRARRILIASHKDPDPDAIGATLGLWHILKTRFRGKVLRMYNASPSVVVEYRALKGASKISHILPAGRFDLVVGLDAGNLSRLALDDYIARHRPRIVYVDHHEPVSVAAEVVWVEPGIESTSQLVYMLAKTLRWPIGPSAAAALMVGIAGDTLHFDRASAETFGIAADLMQCSPQLEEAYHDIFGWQNLGMMKIFGIVFLRSRFVRPKRFIWSYVSRKELSAHGLKAGGLAHFSNYLRNYVGAEVALFLRERDDGAWEGSLRSLDKHPTNLAKLAAKFGGGGHAHASGFDIKLPRDTIVKKILNSLPKRK